MVFASIFNVLFICILANSASKYGERDQKTNRKEIVIVALTSACIAYLHMCVEGHHKLINVPYKNYIRMCSLTSIFRSRQWKLLNSKVFHFLSAPILLVQGSLMVTASNPARQAWENMCNHVMIGFGLVSHWLKKRL